MEVVHGVLVCLELQQPTIEISTSCQKSLVTGAADETQDSCDNNQTDVMHVTLHAFLLMPSLQQLTLLFTRLDIELSVEAQAQTVFGLCFVTLFSHRFL